MTPKRYLYDEMRESRHAYADKLVESRDEYDAIVHAFLESAESGDKESSRDYRAKMAKADGIVKELELAAEIERENLRHELIAAALPYIRAAFARYDGKPYGERTREKIRDEILAEIGCYVWVDGYANSLLKMDFRTTANNYGGTIFYGNDDLYVWTSYDKPIITAENRIDAAAFDTASNPAKFYPDIVDAYTDIKCKMADVTIARKKLEEAEEAMRVYAPARVWQKISK